MMTSNGSQMPIIASDKNELRRCVVHLWKTYNGLGLNLKNGKNDSPHLVRDVDANSPAQYAGVLNNDLIIKIGNRLVENEKFDTVLKLIREQLKKDKKVDLLLINQAFYPEFKLKNMNNNKIDYNSPNVVSQIKYYESPLSNPNSSSISGNATINRANNVAVTPTATLRSTTTFNDAPPEPRLCHLLTWPTYDGYGFYVAYNEEGCYVKNVEPNSPAQMGGLRAYDRIIEINGRPVYAKDREFISKQINKHKFSQASSTMKSQSAYSVGTTRSSKSLSGSNYLNMLVADPNTYKFLNSKKIEISTKNKNLKVQECFTPNEQSLVNALKSMSSSASNINILNNNQSSNVPVVNNTTTPNSADLLKSIVIKLITIRRLKGKESQPLGFEMTKRGTQAHYISKIEPESAAAYSGLSVNDYLIELNEKNIEQDENSVLREKIFNALDPKTGGQFRFLTINKTGYDYCLENKIPISGFIQINNQSIQRMETPLQIETSNGNTMTTTKITTSPQLDRKNEIIVETNHPPNVIISTVINNNNDSNSMINRNDSNRVKALNKPNGSMPRLCILRKTSDTTELGLSIARMKNINEHIINDVVPGSIADQAGVKANDCLLEVNGESVQNKSHVDTVNKIIELARQPATDISLLVVERHQPSKTAVSAVTNGVSENTHQNLTTEIKHVLVREESLNNNMRKNDKDMIYSSLKSNANDLATALKVNEASHQNVSHTVRPSKEINSSVNLGELPSLNAYPEIKIAEFHGYPSGTQLGLVVTSDDYSHDIIKVAHDSPAYKAGVCKGDVVLAVNGINVEGDATLIELINDFSETKPLKLLVASRYAYEWSKLLRIRITEKDWPNIKKFSTKYIPHTSGMTPVEIVNTRIVHPEPTTLINPTPSKSNATATSFNETRNILVRSATTTTTINPKPFQLPQSSAAMHDTFSNRNPYHRSSSANTPRSVKNFELSSPRTQNISFNNYNNTCNRRVLSSASTVRSTNLDHLSLLTTLSRSAVDITADGKVLRMCTLYLDPTSLSPTDSEFGFDLVTKVGGGQRSIGDYYIDTVDENSPACKSGLKSGDRLVEVDGIDVKTRTFEQVVHLINEAKLRSRLKLLVYPSVVINYGNPNIVNNLDMHNHDNHYHYQQQQNVMVGGSKNLSDKQFGLTNNIDTSSRSMPDLSLRSFKDEFINRDQATMVGKHAVHQPNQQQYHHQHHQYHLNHQQHHQQPQYYQQSKDQYKLVTINRPNYEVSKNKTITSNQYFNDYDTIYTKKIDNSLQTNNTNSHLSKSTSNINAANALHANSSSSFKIENIMLNNVNELLRPVPRLCTLYKNDSNYLTNPSSTNIGFGVQTKQAPTTIPNYLRVSIVNYKSPAYLSGMEAGDFIVEINGRNTLSMSHDEALHFIKSSFDINNYVRLLVISEFCYNWLREHNLVGTISTDNSSVFSYSDYLKNNHRFVPRLCKVKLYSFSKSFGFSLESLLIRPSSAFIAANKGNSYQSYAHIIVKVEKDTAAYAANLQKGDRIIECNGINVEQENEKQLIERIYQAFINEKQLTLFVVDPDTDNFFKSKCIKLHSMLPIVQHITNSTDI